MMNCSSLVCWAVCLLLSIIVIIQGASNICTERKAKSCDECVKLPGCAWCNDPDYATNPNVLISRCNTPENLMSGSESCPESSISNPRSSFKNTNDSALSNIGESAIGSATQLKPQVIDVQLRPGDPVQINFSFKQAEDYPVDLYYLLDLSQSMENDLESLRTLGEELGKRMQNITRDFRLGFGSFVDKTVMPYISTTDSKLRNPCSEANPCVPTYSFHNDLPLTSNIQSFVESVNRVTHSSNLDNPEGGLDAMMQAIVCQDRIKWREKATHLLVYSTDATFHYAGDGKLGGIVFPNDGKCYLNRQGHYTMANEMDYPSIGHLVRKITEHKIQPIFAVTQSVISTYENLKKMIPKSVVGMLTSDSSNIIGLIQTAYNDLKGLILIEVTAPSEVNITNKKSFCGGGSESEGLACDGVKLGDVVNFTLSLSSDKCLTESVLIQLQTYGYDETVDIRVHPLCECQCDDEMEAQNHNCSGRGKYECGACVCEEGYTGLDCSCNAEDQGTYLTNCTDPVNGLICNDRGVCQCGNCICNQEPKRKIDGQFCQCDNTTCDLVEGKSCNAKGKCVCGKCECDEGWSGDSCKCNLDTEACYDKREDAPDPDKPCNGNGLCECGICECNTVQGKQYRGTYCETRLVSCERHKDCIQCHAYKTGKYNNTEECKENCEQYHVTMLGEAGSAYDQECRFTDLTDDCTFVVHIEEFENEIYVDVEPKKICQPYANPLHIILGIIAAIVGIGLAILLIWKLLTSIKDAREFKNFQKESQNPRWQGGENPIFKKATSTFKNPMYTGGKPTANM